MYEEVRDLIMKNKTIDRQRDFEKISKGKKALKYTIKKEECSYRVLLSFGDRMIERCEFKDLDCLKGEKVPKFILRYCFKAPFCVNSKCRFSLDLNYVTVAENVEEFLLSANTQYIESLKNSIESYKFYKENPSEVIYNYIDKPTIFQKWNLPKDGSYTKITENHLQTLKILKPSDFVPYKVLVLPSITISEIIVFAYSKGPSCKIYRNKKHAHQDFESLVEEINSLFFD